MAFASAWLLQRDRMFSAEEEEKDVINLLFRMKDAVNNRRLCEKVVFS